MLERERTIVCDCFHGEVGCDCLYIELLYQSLIDPVITLHIARYNFEQIIVVAANSVEIDDIADGKHMLTKLFEPVGGVRPGTDHRENRKPIA